MSTPSTALLRLASMLAAVTASCAPVPPEAASSTLPGNLEVIRAFATKQRVGGHPIELRAPAFGLVLRDGGRRWVECGWQATYAFEPVGPKALELRIEGADGARALWGDRVVRERTFEPERVRVRFVIVGRLLLRDGGERRCGRAARLATTVVVGAYEVVSREGVDLGDRAGCEPGGHLRGS